MQIYSWGRAGLSNKPKIIHFLTKIHQNEYWLHHTWNLNSLTLNWNSQTFSFMDPGNENCRNTSRGTHSEILWITLFNLANIIYKITVKYFKICWFLKTPTESFLILYSKCIWWRRTRPRWLEWNIMTVKILVGYVGIKGSPVPSCIFSSSHQKCLFCHITFIHLSTTLFHFHFPLVKGKGNAVLSHMEKLVWTA